MLLDLKAEMASRLLVMSQISPVSLLLNPVFTLSVINKETVSDSAHTLLYTVKLKHSTAGTRRKIHLEDDFNQNQETDG